MTIENRIKAKFMRLVLQLLYNIWNHIPAESGLNSDVLYAIDELKEIEDR